MKTMYALSGNPDSAVKWLLDTNILIDFLNGVDAAREVLGRDEASAISQITWMEVMTGACDAGEDRLLRGWLACFEVLSVDGPVADEAVRIRRNERHRLPDAIIRATARVSGRILVTRNTRDFPADAPEIHVPYRL